MVPFILEFAFVGCCFDNGLEEVPRIADATE